MSESDLWEHVREGMRSRWHAQRHEDKHSKGIPDVSYAMRRKTDGWVEMKFLPEYPTVSRHKSEKPWDFKLDHFTPEQRNWMNLRDDHSAGRIFLLARLGTSHIIWQWRRVRYMWGSMPFFALEEKASGLWLGRGIDFGQLELILSDARCFPLNYTC